MALPRYDLRRQLVVDEANAIQTTALRAEMLPDPTRRSILSLMREYVDARVDYAKAGLDQAALRASLVRAQELQDKLWRQNVAATQQSPTPITSTFVQSLNEVMDLREKRLAALENRIPPAVWWMLALIAILTCVSTGISMRRRFWFSILLPPLMIAIVLTFVAELDGPRSGLIRVGQQSMERVQQDLNRRVETSK